MFKCLNNKILLLAVNLVLCLYNLLSNKHPSLADGVIEFIRITVEVDLGKVLNTVLK